MDVTKMSDEELLELNKDAYSSVEDVECFSTGQVTLLDITGNELTKRGYEWNDYFEKWDK